jgi:amino acid permease
MTGVLFVACFLLGLALISNTGDTMSGVQSFYADSGNRAKEVTAFFFLVAAGIAFPWRSWARSGRCSTGLSPRPGLSQG